MTKHIHRIPNLRIKGHTGNYYKFCEVCGEIQE